MSIHAFRPLVSIVLYSSSAGGDERLSRIRKHGACITTDTTEYMLQEIQSGREQSMQLALKIEKNRPKVEFAEAVEVSENSVHVGEVAKLIKQKTMLAVRSG